MSQNKTEAIAQGIAALRSYARGSGRGQLVPFDEIVIESLRDPALRQDLEARLIEALSGNLSACAAEYACGKLALMGTRAAVPLLRKLLNQPETAEPALSALRAIPGEASSKALREHLPHRERPCQLAAIHAIGFRRDEDSVPALAQLLNSADHQLSAAAATALGQIGTPKAGRVLREAATERPDLKPPLPDALLNCAELLQKENPSDAKAIYTLLANAPQTHVKQAARRALSERHLL